MFWNRRSRRQKTTAAELALREFSIIYALLENFWSCIWLANRGLAGCPAYHQLLDEAEELLAASHTKLGSDVYAQLRLLPPV